MVKLAKWKRWSREFLPPDPLGGLQSGYARQYHPNDAFTVFLGGYLVASLRYTIPEARQIISDLKQWLLDKRFYLDLEENAAPKLEIDPFVREYQILIRKELHESVPPYLFLYTIRGLISNEAADYKGFSIRREQYIETVLDRGKEKAAHLPPDGIKLLNVTELHRYFSQNLNRNG